jgi:hypothetical protein
MYYIFIICVLKGIQKVVHLTDDLLEMEEKKNSNDNHGNEKYQ